MRKLACLLVGVLLLGACAGTPTRESFGELLDSNAITAKIKTKLWGADIKGISVETFRGRVTLSGFVVLPEERDKAVGLAKEVPGVKEVREAIIVKTEPPKGM